MSRFYRALESSNRPQASDDDGEDDRSMDGDPEQLDSPNIDTARLPSPPNLRVVANYVKGYEKASELEALKEKGSLADLGEALFAQPLRCFLFSFFYFFISLFFLFFGFAKNFECEWIVWLKQFPYSTGLKRELIWREFCRNGCRTAEWPQLIAAYACLERMDRRSDMTGTSFAASSAPALSSAEPWLAFPRLFWSSCFLWLFSHSQSRAFSSSCTVSPWFFSWFSSFFSFSFPFTGLRFFLSCQGHQHRASCLSHFNSPWPARRNLEHRLPTTWSLHDVNSCLPCLALLVANGSASQFLAGGHALPLSTDSHEWLGSALHLLCVVTSSCPEPHRSKTNHRYHTSTHHIKVCLELGIHTVILSACVLLLFFGLFLFDSLLSLLFHYSFRSLSCCFSFFWYFHFFLYRCHRLHTIFLQDTAITDASLKFIATGCAKLRFLDLRNCDHLTDDGVTKLSVCQHLRRIDLTAQPQFRSISDVSLKYLAQVCSSRFLFCSHLLFFSCLLSFAFGFVSFPFSSISRWGDRIYLSGSFLFLSFFVFWFFFFSLPFSSPFFVFSSVLFVFCPLFHLSFLPSSPLWSCWCVAEFMFRFFSLSLSEFCIFSLSSFKHPVRLRETQSASQPRSFCFPLSLHHVGLPIFLFLPPDDRWLRVLPLLIASGSLRFPFRFFFAVTFSVMNCVFFAFPSVISSRMLESKSSLKVGSQSQADWEIGRKMLEEKKRAERRTFLISFISWSPIRDVCTLSVLSALLDVSHSWVYALFTPRIAANQEEQRRLFPPALLSSSSSPLSLLFSSFCFLSFLFASSFFFPLVLLPSFPFQDVLIWNASNWKAVVPWPMMRC